MRARGVVELIEKASGRKRERKNGEINVKLASTAHMLNELNAIW